MLEEAVQSVLTRQASGESATEAMVKTASAMSLSPEQINRVSQIINKSSLNYQRLYTDELNLKLADAEIIDPHEVVQRVYGLESAAKTASDPGESLYNRLRANAVTPVAAKEETKSAAAPALKIKEPAVDKSGYGLYHGLGGSELVRTRNRWDSQKKEAQLELARLYSKAQEELNAIGYKVASYPKSEQVKLFDQAKFYFEERSPVAKQVVLHLADELPAETQAKLAVVPPVPDVWSEKLFRDGFADRVQKLADYIVGMPEKAEFLNKKIAEAEAHLELIDSSCVNGEVYRVGININGSFADCDRDWISRKVANATLMGIGAMNAMKKKDSPSGPSDEERFMLQLRNPQHEAALGSLRTRAALQELMATDPVIKSEKPERVISAFNELSQYSPRAVEHTAALRAGLRAVLQQNTSLFDLDQLRKTERS